MSSHQTFPDLSEDRSVWNQRYQSPVDTEGPEANYTYPAMPSQCVSHSAMALLLDTNLLTSFRTACLTFSSACPTYHKPQ